VLVVDDEIDVAQSLAELVELFGHRVAIETSPVAALDRIGRDAFDFVFTDYRMPGLDGLALRRAIVERVPRLASRVVVVTGDTVVTGGGDDHPSSEPGVVTLEKPFTAADVRALLDRVAAS
jgi:CheY-like chemotaxis protein